MAKLIYTCNLIQQGHEIQHTTAVPSLRRLVAGLSPRSPGFDPGVSPCGICGGKVALRQVFPQVLRVSPVNFIPPVLHYLEKRKKLIIFITGLHSKPEGCCATVASAAGPFTTKKTHSNIIVRL